MKHTSGLTREMPAQAETWQEIVCQVNQVFVDLLSLKGGNAATKSFVADKCDLPDANEDDATS